MKRLVLWAPTVALLAACGGSAVTLQPGQWEMTTTMTNIEVPGAPAAMAEQMRTAMANQPRTENECITPEEAANPLGNMMNQGGGTQGCTFSEQTFAGGVIRMAAACPAPQGGGSMRTNLNGTYTATTMEAQISAEVDAGANTPAGMPRNIRMSGTMTGRRTGDCPAS
ncbi:MAG TPA: DUF3617 domain-containing protein [Allosphingosinicella sp.]|nr:DUF3617 domain-containing protein [Allosphingosinicella sp.]